MYMEEVKKEGRKYVKKEENRMQKQVWKEKEREKKEKNV